MKSSLQLCKRTIKNLLYGNSLVTLEKFQSGLYEFVEHPTIISIRHDGFISFLVQNAASYL